MSEDIKRATDFVSFVVGARLITGDTIAEIVAHLDENLSEIRASCAIASITPLSVPLYVAVKHAVDKLRVRC